MATTYYADIQKLYVAYFNRPADVPGLQFWEGVLERTNGDTSLVSKEFAKSAEYQATYGGQDAYHVVAAIYQNLFGRSPDVEGLNYWAQGLQAGTFTVDNAVTVIANAAQNSDKTTFNNRVTFATAFTNGLDTADEILNYSGAAIGVAKGVLNTINTDASLAAATTPAALAATIASVTEKAGTVGTTFTLTNGVDTPAGTANNDTFNALSVTPAGDAKDTLTSFDTLDGGAGNDTLNIYTTATENESLASSATIKNIETINVYNTAAAAALADVSKYAGVTAFNQIGDNVADVTKLAAGTTAGFQTTQATLNVTAADAAATASVKFISVDEGTTLNVGGAALSGVTVMGTVADADSNKTVDAVTVAVALGKDVQTLSVNSGVKAEVTTTEDLTSSKHLTTIDASASTGAVTADAQASVTTLTGGSGNDTLTINTATVAAATGVTAVSAAINGGAGNDTIEVKTTGDGLTTVNGGAGNDTVTITTRGSGKLTVNLGDGSDNFTADAGAPVNAGDVIDAGAGKDTLALKLVGSANIGAFSNFDAFDAAGLNRTLDVNILASKNTVTEFVASADVGAAILNNVGAGVGVRVTGDMAASTLEVNQKTAAAITVTVDADETGTADDAGETITGAVKTNATSVKAVFDTSYLADNSDTEKGLSATADNYTTLSLTATAATTLDVVSGGANAANNLNVTATKALTSITVSGADQLTIGTVTINGADPSKLATIDASASTGGLITTTNNVADGGTIKLGSGTDWITVGTGSTSAGVESLQGFELTNKVAVSTATADATAAAAAQSDADVLVFSGAAVAADGGGIKNGVLTFSGTGPSDLATAVSTAATAAGANKVVAFEYLGDTYVVDGALVVQLTGITGVTNVGETGTDHFFLV